MKGFMEPSNHIVHKAIESVLIDWKQICRNHYLLDENTFLNKMHNHILFLDAHLNTLVKTKKIHDLLFHLLHTPGGAPIVIQKSISECAKEFSNTHPYDTLFYHYLKKSLTSSNEEDNFLFTSLLILDEELKNLS
jgi:hypothetical protein